MNIINPYGNLFASLTAQQTSSSFTVQQADIISLPKDISALGRSIILKGEVISSGQNGVTIIKTPQGELSLSLKSPLPLGTKIDIQIPNNTALKQAIIQPTLQNSIQGQQTQTTVAHTPAPTSTTLATPVNISTNTSTTQQSSSINDVKTLIATTQQAKLTPTTSTTSQLNIGQYVRITALPPTQQSLNLSLNFASPQQTNQSSQNIISGLIVGNLNKSHLLKSTPLGNLPNSTSLSTNTQGQLPQISFGNNTPNLPLINTPQTQMQLTNLGTAITKMSTLIPQVSDVLAPPRDLMTSSDFKNPQTSAKHPNLKTPIDMIVTSMTPINTVIKPMDLAPLPSILQPSTNLPQHRAGDVLAQVTGFVTEDGNPILSIMTTNGQPQLVSMNYPAKNLATGTILTLSISSQGMSKHQLQYSPLAVFPPAFQFLADNFTNLFPQFILNQMNSIFPSITQSKQFPAAALLFLAAAKNGDISGWLGQRNIKSFQSNPSELIQKLMDDMTANLPAITTKKPNNKDLPQLQTSQDWRGYIIPTHHDMNIIPTTLWVKENPSENDKDNEKQTAKGTRFIVDVHLSRMGDVLFDGFINKDKKIFDLTLFTYQTLGNELQKTLINSWTKSLENMDLSGKISFKEHHQ